MSNPIERLQMMGFQSFSYDHTKQLFTSGDKRISIVDLDPDRIPSAKAELPVSYYKNALLIAHGSMRFVQMPKMTKWLQELTPNDARDVEDEALKIMQDVFAAYRKANGQSKMKEISDSFGVSVANGLTDIGAGTHMIFAFTYCGALVSETDMEEGYIEFDGNNLDDLPGNSIRVAFLAGVGALALNAQHALSNS